MRLAPKLTPFYLILGVLREFFANLDGGKIEGSAENVFAEEEDTSLAASRKKPTRPLRSSSTKHSASPMAMNAIDVASIANGFAKIGFSKKSLLHALPYERCRRDFSQGHISSVNSLKTPAD